jgi:hypothetical protein
VQIIFGKTSLKSKKTHNGPRRADIQNKLRQNFNGLKIKVYIEQAIYEEI